MSARSVSASAGHAVAESPAGRQRRVFRPYCPHGPGGADPALSRDERGNEEEAGKSADFIVLDANPLDDITNTRRIAAVILRGAAVDRSQPFR